MTQSVFDQVECLADNRLHGTEEDRQGAALAVIALTINLYYQLAEANHRIALGEESVVYAERSLNLVQILRTAGGASELEIAAAEQLVETEKASSSLSS